jgi:hypothetical protein
VEQDANIGDQVKRKTSGSLLFTCFIDDRHFERRFRASERLLTTAERPYPKMRKCENLKMWKCSTPDFHIFKFSHFHIIPAGCIKNIRSCTKSEQHFFQGKFKQAEDHRVMTGMLIDTAMPE